MVIAESESVTQSEERSVRRELEGGWILSATKKAIVYQEEKKRKLLVV